MQGLVKLAAFTAPALVLVVALSFYSQREHKAEMNVETAAFERDWNESMAGFEKSKEGRAKYEKRAALAQGVYSSAKIELEQRKKDVDQAGRDLSEGINSIDKQLGERAR